MSKGTSFLYDRSLVSETKKYEKEIKQHKKMRILVFFSHIPYTQTITENCASHGYEQS